MRARGRGGARCDVMRSVTCDSDNTVVTQLLRGVLTPLHQMSQPCATQAAAEGVTSHIWSGAGVRSNLQVEDCCLQKLIY